MRNSTIRPYHDDKTAMLLNDIAKHLSSRNSCKGLEYAVFISKTGCITMYPEIQVYPSRNERRSTDRQSLLRHIFNCHIIGFSKVNDNGFIQVDLSVFTPGHYLYKQSFRRKSRKWIKIT